MISSEECIRFNDYFIYFFKKFCLISKAVDRKIDIIFIIFKYLIIFPNFDNFKKLYFITEVEKLFFFVLVLLRKYILLYEKKIHGNILEYNTNFLIKYTFYRRCSNIPLIYSLQTLIDMLY